MRSRIVQSPWILFLGLYKSCSLVLQELHFYTNSQASITSLSNMSTFQIIDKSRPLSPQSNNIWGMESFRLPQIQYTQRLSCILESTPIQSVAVITIYIYIYMHKTLPSSVNLLVICPNTRKYILLIKYLYSDPIIRDSKLRNTCHCNHIHSKIRLLSVRNFHSSRARTYFTKISCLPINCTSMLTSVNLNSLFVSVNSYIH